MTTHTELQPLAPEDLDAPTREALARRILSLADSKRLMGLRYSDWTLGAPSLEADIATSSMAQDEWGHARLLYSLLKAFGHDPKVIEHERPAEAYSSVGALDHPLENWAQVVAAMIVVDGALTCLMEDLAGGAYEPARSRIPKMVSEEAFHRDLGRAWFRRFAAGTDEARASLKEAVEAFLPGVLAWLDPRDEDASILADVGILGDAVGRVTRFLQSVEPLAAPLGVDLSGIEADHGDWDAGRGRGSGQPADEAIERARGDLNRSLLVE
jgi:phenylacetate-CoA oxygenase PaaI subunit